MVRFGGIPCAKRFWFGDVMRVGLGLGLIGIGLSVKVELCLLMMHSLSAIYHQADATLWKLMYCTQIINHIHPRPSVEELSCTSPRLQLY